MEVFVHDGCPSLPATVGACCTSSPTSDIDDGHASPSSASLLTSISEIDEDSTCPTEGTGAKTQILKAKQQQRDSSSADSPNFYPCILDPNASEFAPMPVVPPSDVRRAAFTHPKAIATASLASLSAAAQGQRLYDTGMVLGVYVPSTIMAPDGVDGSTATFQYTAAGFPFNGDGTPHATFCFPAAGTMDASSASRPSAVSGSVLGSPPLGHFTYIFTPFQVGLLPAMPMPPIVASPPVPMPLIPLPEFVSQGLHCMPDSVSPQQGGAFDVYTHSSQSAGRGHASRALIVSGLPIHLNASRLREELQHWGEVRAFHADKLQQGIVSVQFFDLRASCQALIDVQNQHIQRQQRFQAHLRAHQLGCPQTAMIGPGGDVIDATNRPGLLCGHVVWAQYVPSASVPCPDSYNQGTLVLFNVGEDVGLRELGEIFTKYGDVREVREAPFKRQHKFVEYYDTRDAEAAWAALNGQEICGKCVKIEFSRKGGVSRKQVKDVRIVQSAPNQLFLLRQGQESPGKVRVSTGWQDMYDAGIHQQEHDAGPRPMPFPSLNPVARIHAAQSYQSVHSRYYESLLQCESDPGKHEQAAIAGLRKRQSCWARSASKLYRVVLHEQVYGAASAFAFLPASRKGRPPQISSNLNGHPQFEYDEREGMLVSGHPRTTLMIKNIPNKYSQQMFLTLLDHHCIECNSQLQEDSQPESAYDSAYDFVYLPIDFKNRCNLGYAFVNFTTGLATLKFYKAFHNRPWEAFNSKKICEIKYARVQGQKALENHFCNSRFACDSMEFLPVVFIPPRNGLVRPHPIVAATLMTDENGWSCPSLTPMQASHGPSPLSATQVSETELACEI